MCPPYGHIGATWPILLNLCFLQPTRVYNPNGKSIGSAISAQLTAESIYALLLWANVSPKLPFHGGSGTPSNTWFLGPIRTHIPNGISIGSAVFAQMTAGCPYTLQWDAPSPLKIASSHGGSVTWAQPSPQPKRHLDRFSRFAGLISVTDRQTDHATRSITYTVSKKNCTISFLQ